MANLLVFEEKRDLFPGTRQMLQGMPHSVTRAASLAEAFEAKRGRIDLLVLNKNGKGALDRWFQRLSSMSKPPKFLVVVDKPDLDELELSLRAGALDYIGRENAEDYLRGICARLDTILGEEDPSWAEVGDRFGIYGSCQQIQQCLSTVIRSSHSDVSVLIQGETGTGKELFARAIHGLSSRRGEHLIVVDCASLPETLVESILFGYSKGAFTGADTPNEGLVMRAHKGTLFLDEVSELPLELQKKFLRVLQERRFRPVGAKQEVESDFRIVAATNKNLNEMVEDGRFRADLLYRLQSLKLNLPSLVERGEDLVGLANYFLEKSCAKNHLPRKTFSSDFLDVLRRHNWPGNVRELENVIDSVVAVSYNESVIYPERLPLSIRVKAARNSMSQDSGLPGEDGDVMRLTLFNNWSDIGLPSYKSYRTKLLEGLERKYFSELQMASSGDVAKAMAIANLSRARLYEFYKKFNLTKGNKLNA